MTATPVWSTPLHERVVQVVRSRAGLVFPAEMQPTVEARIHEGMAESSVKELPEYLSLLSLEGARLDDLIDRLTIGETYFFREPSQLEYIRSTVLPEFAQRAPGRPFRAWSAGCSSGEETYSLAILFREAGLESGATVVGTDISTARLAQARRGCFTEWSLRALPEGMVKRYFRRSGKEYRLDREIRKAVTFRTHNLSEDRGPASVGIAGMDLILCRNVLIYLGAEEVAAIARRLLAALSPDGWLFLGASDPQLSELTECQVVVTGAGVAYRRGGASALASEDFGIFSAASAEVSWCSPPKLVEARSSGVTMPVVETRSASRFEHKVEPNAASCSKRTAESLFTARDYVAAAELALRALQQGGDSQRLWEIRIRALAKQGELEQAEQVCGEAIENHRTSAELMCLHAVVLAAGGRLGDAIAAAKRALYLDRQLAMAHVVLGHALLGAGDRPGARRSLETAESLLTALAHDALVPASDDEPAAHLIGLIRRQLNLVAA